jgi:WD40 repeat protein
VDGQTVFISEGNFITFWGINTGEVTRSMTGHTHSVISVISLADENQLLSVSRDGTIRQWDLRSGVEIVLTESLFPYLMMDGEISPDGQMLVSASWNGEISLWDVNSGLLLWAAQGITSAVNSVEFTADGSAMVASTDEGDVATGEPYRRYTGAPNPVDALDVSADGGTLLGGAYNGVARLWRIDDLPTLIEWTHAHRYVMDLTCEQRALYQIKPLCEAGT